MAFNNKRIIGAGFFSAIAASLCCITPVLALISGASGIASTFSWLEPARPYFIGITVLLLGFAWYQKLKPRTNKEIECACENEEKPNFWQSKKFLAIVTVFAALMLAFPKYAHVFYPSSDNIEVLIVDTSDVRTVTFDVEGMTCEGCALHVENDVNKLPGIIKIDAGYQEGTAKVEFDHPKVSSGKIEETINATGYKVSGIK
ncbi:mercuric transport protein MerTP [Marinilabilia salmonicolor]|uniref:Mercuric transport protein MerT n=1 Tax=Marinilabilia salmonicolor TaxID=989 RepID=A0A368VAY4_9BACT|nr:mercuric transport protein MerTP [Marinilabilia salmonicolor]RCW38329.1 copper chaperone CopZ [Marinilabilia salmonicolor]